MKNQVVKVFCFLTLLALIGCGNIKPANAQKSGGLYETFYTGETGLQYFIKPLAFENKDTKEALLVDMIFRDNENKLDSAALNMTFITNDKLDLSKNIKVKTDSSEVELVFKRQIYKEKDKELFHVRIEGNCTKSELFKILSSESLSFHLNSNGKEYVFYPEKKTSRRLSKIAMGVIN